MKTRTAPSSFIRLAFVTTTYNLTGSKEPKPLDGGKVCLCLHVGKDLENPNTKLKLFGDL